MARAGGFIGEPGMMMRYVAQAQGRLARGAPARTCVVNQSDPMRCAYCGGSTVFALPMPRGVRQLTCCHCGAPL